VTEATEVTGETEETGETAYYLSSRVMTARQAGRSVRRRWSIENSLHYVLDISFREDDSRIRLGNAPRNLAALRDIAINLLHLNRTSKRGIKERRKRAAWNPDYLLELLT
jgi:predicted transposase YbfD/YdcC